MPTGAELVALGGVGVVAGAINAVAGGGSLLTFPALVATGLPPLTANITNCISALPGYASAVNRYRPELVGQRPRITRLATPAFLGAGLGVVLLKASSAETFEAVVPWLVVVATVLLALQPRIRAALEARRTDAGADAAPEHHGKALWVGVLLCGAYAAYFGAAVGVILLAVLAIAVDDRLQRLNALNRTLVLVANAVAAVALGILGPVDWASVAVLGPATLIGGDLGARTARRLDERVLRATVVVLGGVVAVWLLVR